VDRPEHDQRIAAAVARLLLAFVAPLLVAALAGFPGLAPSGTDVPAWALPALAAAAALLAATALALAASTALARGAPRAMLHAGALGALAAGLAVVAVRAISGAAPSPDLAAAGAITAVLLLAERLVPDDEGMGLATRVAVAVGVFVAAELALAASLLTPLPAGVAPWAYAGAGILALVASLPRVTAGASLLGGGLLALAVARPEPLSVGLALVALGASAVGLGWEAAGARDPAARRRRHPGRQETPPGMDRAPGIVHGVPWPPADAPRAASLPLMPLRDPSPGTAPDSSSGPADDDMTRLMRELRGTIEELLEARRTVELQRAEIARATAVDPLTNVASRRAILERLHAEAAEARRYDHPIALVLVDVDGFAAINGEHGLEAGDAVLREVALRLRLRVRAADALGRVGSDSFLAILPHADERGAAIFADALLRRLAARPITTRSGELRPSFSVGVAFMTHGMELTDEELLAAADEALASARAAGGNRIAFDRRHGLVRLEERRRSASANADEGSASTESTG
jgi:diguanylate cyclase (GGDEF)-like protein